MSNPIPEAGRNELKAWAFIQREWSRFSEGIIKAGNDDEWFDPCNRDIWLRAFYEQLQERQEARLRMGCSND